jgi:hypothetical protein
VRSTQVELHQEAAATLARLASFIAAARSLLARFRNMHHYKCSVNLKVGGGDIILVILP